MWEVGKAGNGIGRLPHTTPKTPTPTLPKGRELCLTRTASCRLLSGTNRNPQAKDYKPLAAFPDSPDEAGSAGRDPGSMPEEKLRPCCR